MSIMEYQSGIKSKGVKFAVQWLYLENNTMVRSFMLKRQTLHVEIGKLRTEITILGGYSVQKIEGMLGGLTKITDVGNKAT